MINLQIIFADSNFSSNKFAFIMCDLLRTSNLAPHFKYKSNITVSPLFHANYFREFQKNALCFKYNAILFSRLFCEIYRELFSRILKIALCFKYKYNITVSRLFCEIYRELFLRFPNFAL